MRHVGMDAVRTEILDGQVDRVLVFSPSLWQDADMDKEEIIARLRQHESELKAAGIVRLALFGSVARGDATPESDVDLMAEFDAAMKFTILGRVGLENRLADLLGAKVDLAHTPMMREGVRERAAREALTVFSDTRLSFQHILDAVEMIEQFTMGMSFEGFRADPKTVAAVERKLQTISEAAIRLGPGAESNWPELPWREIRGIGNWRRHQCERIEFPLLWNTVEQDLPRLKGVALRVLAWNPG